MVIHALIADDELPARNRIRALLKQEKDIEIMEECSNGQQAVEMILTLKPDLVFLDIQMPEMDGFSVIEAIGAENMPIVIFVTAFDRYAIRAFDVHAVDYLLKPYTPERFRQALDRARSHLENAVKDLDLRERLMAMMEHIQKEREYLDRIVVKSDDRILFVKTEMVDWIEAADNYVQIHAGPETYIIRKTMAEMEKRLNPDQFIRIHRSAIVNIEKIKELQHWFSGEYLVILNNGQQIQSSRHYSDRLHQLIRKN